jgi:pimeloyl-ACP methyl ester carboxylesterase
MQVYPANPARGIVRSTSDYHTEDAGLLLQVMGKAIYAEQAGANGGNVLMLHGWGCTSQHFKPVAQAMASRYKVTLFDFPAHGKSEKPGGTWDLQRFTELTAQLIINLGIAPCDIIAHSFGGRVALLLASGYPELVGKLVLTGCAGIKNVPTPKQKRRARAYKRLKSVFEWFEKNSLTKPAAGRAAELLRKRFGSPDYNALDADMRITFSNIIAQDLRPFLPRIKKPVLLVWGENDRETPLWMGKVMESEIPDAGLVVFEKEDHFAYLHQWRRFVSIVNVFFGGE